MALHPDEWLKQAKSLPIGRSKRTYHGAEKRPNLVVHNHEDRWSCYCHRCHEGGVVMKEFVKVGTVSTKLVAESPNLIPDDARAIASVSHTDLSKIVCFLHDKHMHLDMLQAYKLHYSKVRDRLLFYCPDQVVGRYLGSHSTAKWMTYNSTRSYVRTSTVPIEGNVVVLCEDVLSAIKAARYLPTCCVVALMGTTIQNDLLKDLLSAEQVLLLLDNDKAGRDGSVLAIRAFRLLNILYSVMWCTEECDPKDMPSDWFLSIEVKLRGQQTTTSDDGQGTIQEPAPCCTGGNVR